MLCTLESGRHGYSHPFYWSLSKINPKFHCLHTDWVYFEHKMYGPLMLAKICLLRCLYATEYEHSCNERKFDIVCVNIVWVILNNKLKCRFYMVHLRCATLGERNMYSKHQRDLLRTNRSYLVYLFISESKCMLCK